MIKPGSRDVKLQIRIAGAELDELQRFTWMMVEAFGLDRRIERYRGKRPIGLWRWDIECLQEVISMALKDPVEYPDHSTPGYAALRGLYERVRRLYADAFDELYTPDETISD
jgi:hypothetical protein